MRMTGVRKLVTSVMVASLTALGPLACVEAPIGSESEAQSGMIDPSLLSVDHLDYEHVGQEFSVERFLSLKVSRTYVIRARLFENESGDYQHAQDGDYLVRAFVGVDVEGGAKRLARTESLKQSGFVLLSTGETIGRVVNGRLRAEIKLPFKFEQWSLASGRTKLILRVKQLDPGDLPPPVLLEEFSFYPAGRLDRALVAPRDREELKAHWSELEAEALEERESEFSESEYLKSLAKADGSVHVTSAMLKMLGVSSTTRLREKESLKKLCKLVMSSAKYQRKCEANPKKYIYQKSFRIVLDALDAEFSFPDFEKISVTAQIMKEFRRSKVFIGGVRGFHRFAWYNDASGGFKYMGSGAVSGFRSELGYEAFGVAEVDTGSNMRNRGLLIIMKDLGVDTFRAEMLARMKNCYAFSGKHPSDARFLACDQEVAEEKVSESWYFARQILPGREDLNVARDRHSIESHHWTFAIRGQSHYLALKAMLEDETKLLSLDVDENSYDLDEFFTRSFTKHFSDQLFGNQLPGILF